MVRPVTVGLDILRTFPTPTAPMRWVKTLRRKLHRVQVEAFFANSIHAWAASKPAQQRIVGPPRSRSWAIRFGSCRRHT
jgi:hypothetical protein